jgi:hypothetical protein
MGESRPLGVPTEGAPDVVCRWECRCRVPAVLLGTYEPSGRVNLKVRDRYWHVEGVVRTNCPRCGAEHVLDLRSDHGSVRTEPVGCSPICPT